MNTLDEKYEKLRAQFAALPSLAVAYSGGVDSAYLMHAAHEVLGAKCHGILADSPSLPRHELAAATALAAERNWSLRIIVTSELEDPRYASNPVNRCYYCKSELFDRLTHYALANDIATLAYGENADDAQQVRPGQKAAKEFAILAPLREAGLTKANVRELSRRAGLPTASKPAQPCLSSRIQHGLPVTSEALAQVEAGENILRSEGFHIFRVRHLGDRARVQVAPRELVRLQEPALQREIARQLEALGFAAVEFDPEGYQGASLA